PCWGILVSGQRARSYCLPPGRRQWRCQVGVYLPPQGPKCAAYDQPPFCEPGMVPPIVMAIGQGDYPIFALMISHGAKLATTIKVVDEIGVVSPDHFDGKPWLIFICFAALHNIIRSR